MAIFIDAKKAFDRVEWEFLVLALEKLKIGSFFYSVD